MDYRLNPGEVITLLQQFHYLINVMGILLSVRVADPERGLEYIPPFFS
jgi:hypothetical protein